jgi:hypothetical protein
MKRLTRCASAGASMPNKPLRCWLPRLLASMSLCRRKLPVSASTGGGGGVMKGAWHKLRLIVDFVQRASQTPPTWRAMMGAWQGMGWCTSMTFCTLYWRSGAWQLLIEHKN